MEHLPQQTEVNNMLHQWMNWPFFENLGDERLHIDVYGDTNYKQMTIRLGYVDEKSAVHQLTFHLFKIDKLWKIVLEE